MNRKALEIALESVRGFREPKECLEQYVTPSTIAADLLWEAYMAGDIDGKVLVDLGCGTGRLSYGGLILGARCVICLDIDYEALKDAEAVLHYAEHAGIACSIACDCCGYIPLRSPRECVVIMNPPFGIRRRGTDLRFLVEAIKLCNTVYSIHRLSQGLLEAVRRRIAEAGFSAEVRVLRTFKYPIRWFLPKHRRKVHYVDAVFLKVTISDSGVKSN